MIAERLAKEGDEDLVEGIKEKNGKEILGELCKIDGCGEGWRCGDQGDRERGLGNLQVDGDDPWSWKGGYGREVEGKWSLENPERCKEEMGWRWQLMQRTIEQELLGHLNLYYTTNTILDI